jgi:putative FmdB family regulatory protein
MPLYEYQCDACGHRFERIQKYSDPIADTCPVCGGAVRKLMSSPAIQFKGSGFYITDYPKKDQGGTDKSDGGSAEKATKNEGTSGKSDKGDKRDKGDKGDKGDKRDKGDKATTAAASDKGTPTSTSSSGSSDSSSASAPKTGTPKTST